MGVVRCRDSVRFDQIRPAGFRILAALDDAASSLGHDFIITSGTDSHEAPDPHWSGEAYDVSVMGLTPGFIVRLVNHLRVTLGPLFTVLYECPSKPDDATLQLLAYVNPHATGPHLHAQRKRDTMFPPEVA